MQNRSISLVQYCIVARYGSKGLKEDLFQVSWFAAAINHTGLAKDFPRINLRHIWIPLTLAAVAGAAAAGSKAPGLPLSRPPGSGGQDKGS